MLTMEDLLLTLEEAGEKLRISKYTVRKLIETGELEGIKVGKKRWLVKTSAVERYIHRNTKPEEK